MNRDSLCGDMEEREFLSGKRQWAKACEYKERNIIVTEQSLSARR